MWCRFWLFFWFVRQIRRYQVIVLGYDREGIVLIEVFIQFVWRRGVGCLIKKDYGLKFKGIIRMYLYIKLLLQIKSFIIKRNRMCKYVRNILKNIGKYVIVGKV